VTVKAKVVKSNGTGSFSEGPFVSVEVEKGSSNLLILIAEPGLVVATGLLIHRLLA